MGNKMGRGGFAEPLGENASHSSSAKAQGLLETGEFLKYIHFFGPKPQNFFFFLLPNYPYHSVQKVISLLEFERS